MKNGKRALDPRDVAVLRHALLEHRSRLLRTVATTAEELATLETRQPGAPIEHVAREQVLGILSRLDDQERHELDEIHAACARLDAGTFGVCERCGGDLPLDRLRAVPETRYCITCQTRVERAPR